MKKILLKTFILGIALNFSLTVNNIWAEGWENKRIKAENSLSSQPKYIRICRPTILNKTQKSVEKFETRNVRSAGGIGLGDPNEEGDGPISAPVGEGLGVLCSLGLLYGGYVFLKKRSRENFS